MIKTVICYNVPGFVVVFYNSLVLSLLCFVTQIKDILSHFSFLFKSLMVNYLQYDLGYFFKVCFKKYP